MVKVRLPSLTKKEVKKEINEVQTYDGALGGTVKRFP